MCLMINNLKISNFQVLSLIALGSYGSAVFFLTEIINIAGRTAWVTPLFIEFIILPAILLIIYASKDYDGLTIFEIVEHISGKLVSSIICLIYIGINIVLSIFNLALATNITKSNLLHTTPFWIPLFLTLLIATFIASSGIEVIGRICALLIPILTLCYIAFLLIGYDNFDFNNLKPFLDKGIDNWGNSFYLTNSILSEVLLLLFVLTSAMKNKAIILGKVAKSSLIIFVIIPMFIIVSYIGILSQEVSSMVAFGGLNISMFAGIERYVQGTEIFVLVVIIFFSILKITTFLYCIRISFNQIFNKKVKNPVYILLPSSIIIFIGALTYFNFNYVYKQCLLFYQYIVIPFSLALILFTLILIFFKRAFTKKGAINND